MNIVILHRIPFRKIRYDLAVDHRQHTVRYLSAADGLDELPADAERRLLGVPTDDIQAMIERHGDWLADADRLIARSEYDLLPAALLREKFGIPGDLPGAVLPVRDKWLMRTLAERAGIPQPAFRSVEAFRADPPREGTYLIKPRLEASSTGIELGPADVVLERLDACPDPDAVFVEEFVPGEIWHLDGCLRDGELVALVSSVYVGDCLAYAHGSPLGSAQTSDHPEAVDLLRRTLAALGQRHGCFHFEAIREPDGRFRFLETASRIGGAGVAETFELRTGVDLYQADLRYQLWGDTGPVEPRPAQDHYGWFVFPGHHRTERAAVDFDPQRFGTRLRSYVRNTRPAAHAGRISYATAATPLSGVVQGSAPEVRRTLGEILTQPAGAPSGPAVMEQR
ncbi:acetyl-CoA carboxylase biotin carboxylase subunit family protein [Kitasatospora sp. NPDC093550]|uniref:ATP-grasp domain-containing protein n=1 Tax=Kitasatospora sp. NPDC093550 TaxID=3364089 RepID=UPI0037FFC1F8